MFVITNVQTLSTFLHKYRQPRLTITSWPSIFWFELTTNLLPPLIHSRNLYSVIPKAPLIHWSTSSYVSHLETKSLLSLFSCSRSFLDAPFGTLSWNLSKRSAVTVTVTVRFFLFFVFPLPALPLEYSSVSEPDESYV